MSPLCAQQAVHDVLAEQARPARFGRLADDDLGDVLGVGVADDLLGDVVPAEGDRLGPQPLGQLDVLHELLPLRRVSRLVPVLELSTLTAIQRALSEAAMRLEVRMTLAEVGLGPTQTSRVSDDGPGLLAARRRRAGRLQVRVDAVGRAPQGDLAERAQVGAREEALHGPLGLGGDVDLALAQPLEQLARRQVDQLDRVGLVEDRVGHRLADLDAGDLGDDVVEALEVLDVERGVDVDAGVEQLLDVLPALGVSQPGGVGVGQLIDEEQLGCRARAASRSNSRSLTPRYSTSSGGQHLQPLEQRLGLRPAVRLDVADDHVHAGRRLLLGGLEHGVGLAHAGHVAEEDLELAPVRAGAPRPGAAPGACRDRGGSSLHAPITASAKRVKGQVQLEHVHPRLAQDSPVAGPSVCSATRARTVVRRQAPRPGHPRHLVLGRRRADVRVEAAGRGGDQVDRHRPVVAGIGRPQRLRCGPHSGLEQRRVGRTQVGAARTPPRCRERRRRRGPRPEVRRGR